MRSGRSGMRLAHWALGLGTLLWIGILSVPHLTGQPSFTDTFEYRLLDLRHRLVGPTAAVPELVIVAIDDETLGSDIASDLGRRGLLALLISTIADSGAKTLALDVLLADAGELADNKALAEALAKMPVVVASALGFDQNDGATSTEIRPRGIFADQALVGLVNLVTDADGTPRYAPVLIAVAGEARPSLPLLAAASYKEEKVSVGANEVNLGTRSILLDFGLNMPLRYLGPAGTVPTISAATLLDGPRASELTGKLVVLGFSATATGDRFSTPFDESMPGMEVIGTAISQLAGGSGLRQDQLTRQVDVAHAISLALLSVLALTFWPLSRGVTTVGGLVLLSLVGVTAMFGAEVWLSASLPLFAAVPAALVAGGLRYTRERAQAMKSAQAIVSLRRFQSPALARRIERDPDYLSVPQEQQLVIFFVDLTGFTALSQRLGAAGTRNLLQVFHRLCDQTIESRNGSIFNYMGDGVMAVFGQEQGTSPADDALSAAFDLVDALSTTRLEDAPGTELRCRIGLHLGDVTLSRLGGDNHQQVTVSGDTVNFASRLMEVAKEESAVIAASNAFCDSTIDTVKLKFGQLRKVSIRGREGQEHVVTWSARELNKKNS